MTVLSLGYSPCPNDTFLFYPLVHGRVETGGIAFRERLEDVETLNRLAREEALDVCKVSYHAYAHIRETYVLLRSGGAMGRGCGPLIVAREGREVQELGGRSVASPGEFTTASLLLGLFAPEIGRVVQMPFHEIMPAVARGEVDAGVIIHESRFTFPQYGLKQVADLGEWWERRTGLPLPLGGIAARRCLGESLLRRVNGLVRKSVESAFHNPDASAGYIGAHAREMSPEVCASHIGLYVNRHSLDPGADGEKAAETLFSMGIATGLLPRSGRAIYLPPEPSPGSVINIQ